MIARLKQSPPQKFGLFPLNSQAIAFLKQAHALDYHLALFGSDLFDSPELIKSSEGKLEGAFFSNADVSRDFRERYRRTFGTEELIEFAGHSYDFANLLGQTVREEPEAYGIKLFANLAKQPFHGVCGVLNFVDSPEVGKYWQFPVTLKRIQGTR